MDSLKNKLLEDSFDRIINVGCCVKPYQDLSDIIATDIMIFGTAKDEQLFSFGEIDQLFKSQYLQMENMQPSVGRKRLFERISLDENTAIIVEELQLSFGLADNVNTILMRASATMEYIKDVWKLTHWHASTAVNTENDPWHFEQWKHEKEKLQKLVDEQTASLIQKNRELEIETALERIRAQATAMQESSDLFDVVVSMRNEFLALGHQADYFWHMKWLTDSYEMSMTSEDGKRVGMVIKLPKIVHEQIEQLYNWEQGSEPTIALALNAEQAWNYIENMNTHGHYELADPHAPSKEDIEHIGGLTFIIARTSHGEIGYSLAGEVPNPPQESLDTLVRFAKAFDLAYKRFEDLKNAEQRARAAQIEMALEKVRSRSLAMHQTAELQEVIVTVNQQFKELGVDISGGAFIVINNDIQNEFYCWGAGGAGDYVQKVHIPILSRPISDHLPKEIRNRTPFFTESYSNEEKKAFFTHLFKFLPFSLSSEDKKQNLLSLSGGYSRSCAVSKHTSIFIINHHGKDFSDEENTILKQMARVFEQAYTRFLDLERAEKQAYESNIEASLERVRGMAASMNHSDDLKQIAETMFMELEILKINPLRYGLAIMEDDKTHAEIWASTVNDGHYLGLIGRISLNWHPMLQKVAYAWEGQIEEVIYKLEGVELNQYYEKISTINTHIPNVEELLDPDTDIVQYASLFPFKSGVLYAFTENEPNEEGKSIMKRFANVFEQAHIRFDDLQTTEKQAQLIREERDRLEIALKKLKATQDQLIQQEKLASLGQLTAGIAHEIKNPLNFVNNFSEVSVEMMEELKGERSKVIGDRDESMEDEIIDDVIQNLAKIHEHGTRADSIVKSMLQHSRGGSGKMENTVLNPMVKEFVNLCFHGMKASKKPINVNLIYELDELVGEVPLISEDFSRVIINICNNAFDAMREKGEKNDEKREKYLPKLTVRTKQNLDSITIEIVDNGPGIPEEMKDKILQPFFTTKKGTAGTGLGLSITNDIIKAHGGELRVVTKENEGSEFVISLPHE